MKKQGFELEPGVFPYTPDPSPNPDIEPGPERRDDPDRNDDPERDPKHGRRVSGKSKSSLDAMKEVGSTPIPEIKSNIHCLTIIFQLTQSTHVKSSRNNIPQSGLNSFKYL